ncbi:MULTISPECIES: sensor histidine kinase [Catenuloplanes]|uniref:histidine kinase n=1 Tax=Catenuloplanes niger TaxID=587534 RepID=A0AAE4CY73_9ACTN|nr:ATP-binding protein [Catenuloplanes niger]MDR7325529.1 PAS domain S-box-containing protein [Catenuloplanes niger]
MATTGSTAVTGTDADWVHVSRRSLSQDAADRLAELAARATGAPTGLVQLLEGRSMLMSGGYHLPAVWADLGAIPAASTLAGVILDSGCPLVVHDVLDDARVPPDAPVRRADARAYLGYPVRSRTGAVVGVCAVVDYRPRDWTVAEQSVVGHAAEVCGTFVAEREALENADRHRRFLDAVLDNLHDGVVACDADGRRVLINAPMLRFTGRTPEPFAAGGHPLDFGLRHADGRPMAPEDTPLSRAFAGEELHGLEVLADSPMQRPRVLLVDGQPIADASGERLGAVVALQDVTELKRTERFRDCELAVASALAEAASATEAGPRVLEAVVRTLGWAHAELWLVDGPGGVLRTAAHWSAPGSVAEMHVPDQLAYGQGISGKAWLTGEPVWIRDLADGEALLPADTIETSQLHAALAIPVRSGDDTLGVLAFFAEVVEDPEDALVALLAGIAAHVGQFLERRRAEDLELQLARSKDEYLALIGHEMRTPLTSISAYTSLLREATPAQLTADGPALLEVIDRNTTLLRGIIDDLLDLAALDTGHATVQLTPCDLAEVVREAADAARSSLTGDSVTVRVDTPAELVLPGDRLRLRRVLDNLIGNAIKYSPDGGEVTVTLTADGDYAAELVVADRGIGIPPDERDRLFSRFYRSSRTRDRAIPGSGLGLAISRAIIERHHGTIALLNPDSGTAFQIRLPMNSSD